MGVDTHARRAENLIDFAAGRSANPLSAIVSFDGVTGRAEVQRRDSKMQVYGVQAANPPRFAEELTAILDSYVESATSDWGFTLSFDRDTHSHRRAAVSWLRSAYLACFAQFGYRYAFREVLAKTRAQIRYPLVKFIDIPHSILPSADPSTRAIAFVEEPAWLRGIAVQMGVHLVLLPWLDTDLDFYRRIKTAVPPRTKCTLSGKVFPWPRSATYMLDMMSKAEAVGFYRAMNDFCGWTDPKGALL